MTCATHPDLPKSLRVRFAISEIVANKSELVIKLLSSPVLVTPKPDKKSGVLIPPWYKVPFAVELE